MASNKKYQRIIVQRGDTWTAQIVRQVSSKKTHVSKEQCDFTSEQEAMDWGEAALAEFTATQSSSNRRHAEQRKKNEELKRQRSSRRADKTAAAKEAKAVLKESNDVKRFKNLGNE